MLLLISLQAPFVIPNFSSLLQLNPSPEWRAAHHWLAGGLLGCGWILGGGRAHQWQCRAPGAAAEGAFCAGSPATRQEWVPLLPLLESDELVILCVPETSPGHPATENDFLVVFIPTDLHPPHKAHREGARFPKHRSAEGSWSRHCGGRLGPWLWEVQEAEFTNSILSPVSVVLGGRRGLSGSSHAHGT